MNLTRRTFLVGLALTAAAPAAVVPLAVPASADGNIKPGVTGDLEYRRSYDARMDLWTHTWKVRDGDRMHWYEERQFEEQIPPMGLRRATRALEEAVAA